jgi:hypothetical protein
MFLFTRFLTIIFPLCGTLQELLRSFQASDSCGVGRLSHLAWKV